MKKEIHPKYREVKIKIGKDEFVTMSACKDDVIYMDIDYRQHPAWTKSGVAVANAADENVKSFNSKYAGLSFGAKK